VHFERELVWYLGDEIVKLVNISVVRGVVTDSNVPLFGVLQMKTIAACGHELICVRLLLES
jgi:hypothetical protein